MKNEVPEFWWTLEEEQKVWDWNWQIKMNKEEEKLCKLFQNVREREREREVNR